MENEKLLNEIEELKNRIIQLEKNRVPGKGFWHRAFSGLHIVAGVFISAIITSAVLYAADLVTFTDGTVISASDVNNNFNNLDTRITALEAELDSNYSDVEGDYTALNTQLQELRTIFNGVTRSDNVIRFSHVNVQIVSGSGTTNGTINGLGNLIIGYNESNSDTRTGSHNLVIGSYHSYSSYGGFVAGCNNTISGIWASVSGGDGNTASGYYTSVTGGHYNTASNFNSSISGGQFNTASYSGSSVCGGNGNTTTATYQVLP